MSLRSLLQSGVHSKKRGKRSSRSAMLRHQSAHTVTVVVVSSTGWGGNLFNTCACSKAHLFMELTHAHAELLRETFLHSAKISIFKSGLFSKYRSNWKLCNNTFYRLQTQVEKELYLYPIYFHALFRKWPKKSKNSGFSPTFRSWICALSRWDYCRMETNLKGRCFTKKPVNFLKNNQRTISHKSERDLIRVFENVGDCNLVLSRVFGEMRING